MPKLFVVSDIHGFYDEMMNALDEAGFDPSNEEHWLISFFPLSHSEYMGLSHP